MEKCLRTLGNRDMDFQTPRVPDQTKEIEKPPFLYHGSPNGEIKEFEPRISYGTGTNFGKLVYASSDIKIASIFMIDTQNWSVNFHENNPYVIMSEAREDVVKSDVGGYVYFLPSDTFSFDLNRGMEELEWASPVKVKPEKKEFYKSTLTTVMNYQIPIYFIGEENYRKYRLLKSPEEKFKFVSTFETENSRRGLVK